MNIVVDASVVIAVVLDEPEKKTIVSNTKNATLIAPNSLHWEMEMPFL